MAVIYYFDEIQMKKDLKIATSALQKIRTMIAQGYNVPAAAVEEIERRIEELEDKLVLKD